MYLQLPLVLVAEPRVLALAHDDAVGLDGRHLLAPLHLGDARRLPLRLIVRLLLLAQLLLLTHQLRGKDTGLRGLEYSVHVRSSVSVRYGSKTSGAPPSKAGDVGCEVRGA